jgi:hypothetical protein
VFCGLVWLVFVVVFICFFLLCGGWWWLGSVLFFSCRVGLVIAFIYFIFTALLCCFIGVAFSHTIFFASFLFFTLFFVCLWQSVIFYVYSIATYKPIDTSITDNLFLQQSCKFFAIFFLLQGKSNFNFYVVALPHCIFFAPFFFFFFCPFFLQQSCNLCFVATCRKQIFCFFFSLSMQEPLYL